MASHFYVTVFVNSTLLPFVSAFFRCYVSPPAVTVDHRIADSALHLATDLPKSIQNLVLLMSG